MSAVTCEERATSLDSPKLSRPPGCATFSPLRRCSSVTDRRGYAPSSRLGETKNRQQRGMARYFNRLLREFGLNLRILAVIQIRNATDSKLFGKPRKLSFSAANNRASLLWDPWQRLAFRAQSRQFPLAKRRRHESRSSLREDALRKPAESKAGDYRRRFRSSC